MLEEPKYKLIAQLNLEEHTTKAHCLNNMRYHYETISASHRQLQITSSYTC